MGRQQVQAFVSLQCFFFAMSAMTACNRGEQSEIKGLATAEAVKTGMPMPRMEEEFAFRLKAGSHVSDPKAVAKRLGVTLDDKSYIVATSSEGENLLLAETKDELPMPLASVGPDGQRYQWSFRSIEVAPGSFLPLGIFIKHKVGEPAKAMVSRDGLRSNLFVYRTPRTSSDLVEPMLVSWLNHIEVENGPLLYRVGNSIFHAMTDQPVMSFSTVGRRVWVLEGGVNDPDLASGDVLWSPGGKKIYSLSLSTGKVTAWDAQDDDSMLKVGPVDPAKLGIPSLVAATRDRLVAQGYGKGAVIPARGHDTLKTDIRCIPLLQVNEMYSEPLARSTSFGLTSSGKDDDSSYYFPWQDGSQSRAPSSGSLALYDPNAHKGKGDDYVIPVDKTSKSKSGYGAESYAGPAGGYGDGKTKTKEISPHWNQASPEIWSVPVVQMTTTVKMPTERLKNDDYSYHTYQTGTGKQLKSELVGGYNKYVPSTAGGMIFNPKDAGEKMVGAETYVLKDSSGDLHGYVERTPAGERVITLPEAQAAILKEDKLNNATLLHQARNQSAAGAQAYSNGVEAQEKMLSQIRNLPASLAIDAIGFDGAKTLPGKIREDTLNGLAEGALNDGRDLIMNREPSKFGTQSLDALTGVPEDTFKTIVSSGVPSSFGKAGFGVGYGILTGDGSKVSKEIGISNGVASYAAGLTPWGKIPGVKQGAKILATGGVAAVEFKDSIDHNLQSIETLQELPNANMKKEVREKMATQMGIFLPSHRKICPSSTGFDLTGGCEIAPGAATAGANPGTNPGMNPGSAGVGPGTAGVEPGVAGIETSTAGFDPMTGSVQPVEPYEPYAADPVAMTTTQPYLESSVAFAGYDPTETTPEGSAFSSPDVYGVDAEHLPVDTESSVDQTLYQQGLEESQQPSITTDW